MTSGSPCLTPCPRPAERDRSSVRVRAPREDESSLAVPPLADVGDAACENNQRLRNANCELLGRSLADLREWSRQEACRAAFEFTRRLEEQSGAGPARCPEPAPGASAHLYVAGHQPTLFHPGVWIKNFVIGEFARREDAVSLNLIVDNDTLSETSIRVPAGRPDAPTVVNVAFDGPRPESPWEEARVLDRGLFASFAERVAAAVAPWGFEPLVAEYWPAAVAQLAHSDSLSRCLTAARMSFERRLGLANLELPLSVVCRLEPFLWFTCHILAELPRFHAIYNETVAEYRRVQRIRSRTHPVPDLRTVDDWLEAPFWVWRAGATHRRRVLVRRVGRDVSLSDGGEVFAVLPLAAGCDASAAVAILADLDDRGVRLRTRALSTTLYARLCLADMFVHGIGGARYDEMTDHLMSRFFGLQAPRFLTLTATVLLPVAGHRVSAEDASRLKHQLRELEFHSDRHLSPADRLRASQLIAEKHSLIAEQNAIAASRRQRRTTAASRSGYARFRRFQEVNRLLARLTVAERRRLEDEWRRTAAQLSANSVLRDREYAFCLYPARKLARFFEHVCSGWRN